MINKFVNKKADTIVEDHYKKTKNTHPFTQSAEIANDLLSYKVKGGRLENKDGNIITDPKAAQEFNDALSKNLKDHKTGDYMAKLERLPIIQNNIATKKPTTVKTNPTIERYKQFREDKTWKENYEKEYSDGAIQKHVRAKENKNRIAGKAPYKDFNTSDIIVAEDTKDRAKKNLKFLNKKSEQLPLPNIDILIEPKPSELPDFKTFMKSVAPIKDPDLDAGIAGLEEVKNFKNTMDHADQKFPKKARGIGPFLTGEND